MYDKILTFVFVVLVLSVISYVIVLGAFASIKVTDFLRIRRIKRTLRNGR